MKAEDESRHNLPDMDTASGGGEWLNPALPVTLDDIDAVLAAPEPLADRRERLLAMREALSGYVPGENDGDLRPLLLSLNSALARMERATRRSGNRLAAGLDPTGRADTQSPEDILTDDWRLDPDPTHRT